MRWIFLPRCDVRPQGECDVLGVYMTYHTDWSGVDVSADCIFARVDFAAPYLAPFYAKQLRYLRGRCSRLVVMTPLGLPSVRGVEFFEVMPILPYFHHIPYHAKPLEERDIVLHYGGEDLTSKGTDEILSLLPLITELGYRLVVYSWRPLPLPPSVEAHSGLSLDKVFALHARARVFITATAYDSFSRATLYAMKFKTPVIVKDKGSGLACWLRKLSFPIFNEPIGVCASTDDMARMLRLLLTDDDAWHEAVWRIGVLMGYHSHVFNEYEIAESMYAAGIPFPSDFKPSHVFFYVGSECFPSNLRNCGCPTIVAK